MDGARFSYTWHAVNHHSNIIQNIQTQTYCSFEDSSLFSKASRHSDNLHRVRGAALMTVTGETNARQGNFFKKMKPLTGSKVGPSGTILDKASRPLHRADEKLTKWKRYFVDRGAEFAEYSGRKSNGRVRRPLTHRHMYQK